VSEAAIVGYRHDIKGQGICAYVTLVSGESPSAELKRNRGLGCARRLGRWQGGPHRIPSRPAENVLLQMRRILRKIAEDEFGPIGDS
jgi:acetyl-CoA synthetase